MNHVSLTVRLLLDALAVARLTQLVIRDTILEGVRERLKGRRTYARDLGGDPTYIAARPRVALFLSCPWCVSPWLATIVVALQALIPAVWLYPSAVLAFSQTAAVIFVLTG